MAVWRTSSLNKFGICAPNRENHPELFDLFAGQPPILVGDAPRPISNDPASRPANSRQLPVPWALRLAWNLLGKTGGKVRKALVLDGRFLRAVLDGRSSSHLSS